MMPIAAIVAIPNVRAEENSLYYNVGNQKIPLVVQTDSIAVLVSKHRGANGKSPMSLLQQDFGAGGIRGSGKSTIAARVQPLDRKYAIITAISDPLGCVKLKQQAETKPYIETILPVLNIPGTSSRLVLPNETIVQFKPGISSIDRAEILSRHHFDPQSATELQFARGFYLVKATVRGLDVLTATNQLSKAPGVQSSMPNFIQVQPTFDRGKFGIGETSNPQIK